MIVICHFSAVFIYLRTKHLYLISQTPIQACNHGDPDVNAPAAPHVNAPAAPHVNAPAAPPTNAEFPAEVGYLRSIANRCTDLCASVRTKSSAIWVIKNDPGENLPNAVEDPDVAANPVVPAATVWTRSGRYFVAAKDRIGSLRPSISVYWILDGAFTFALFSVMIGGTLYLLSLANSS